MRARRWLVAVLVAIAVVPGVASAHATLVSSEPAAGARLDAPPSFVRLVFSAPVEEAFLTVRVRAPDGRVVSGPPRRDPRVARAVIVPVRAVGAGEMRVEWRVLSQDGHPSGGAFAFGVERAPAAVAGSAAMARSDHGPLAVLARLLALGAPLGMLGLVTLGALVVAPAVRAGGIAPPGEAAERADAFRERAGAALEGASAGWWRAWWILAVAGAAGLILWPVALLRGLRAGPGDLGDLLLHSRAGAAWWVQVACLAAACAGAWALGRRDRAIPRALGTGGAWLLGLPPAIALVAISWAGHASSGGDRTANIVIDALHGGATAVWLGGLLGLATLVSPAVVRLGDADRVRLAAAVVVRFSAVALVAVAVLVVTGVYRALAEVALGEVLDSDYGRVLVVKLALFAVLLAGGAYNRMVVHPRLERAALGLDPDDRGATAALRVSVRAELVLAAALLVSVALLISLPPPA